ncbi:MAG: hypothetical protein AAFP77_13555 [Bacteroidota bacterium]
MNDDKPTIGDCFALEWEEQFYALILISIVKTIKSIEYSSLLVGKIFNEQPNQNDIRQAGVLGRRIPSSCDYEDIESGDYIKKGLYQRGYEYITLSEKYTLDTFLNEAVFISNFSISAKHFPTMGSLGISGSVEEISNSIQRHVKQIGQFTDSLSHIKQEVFALEDILALNGELPVNDITEKWIFCQENAHPRALELLKEEFYWNTIDEYAPFGNDDGYDMVYLYRSWLENEEHTNPHDFIAVYESYWGETFDHLDELDVTKIDSFKDESYYFVGIDKGFIALCFSDLVLRGTMAPEFIKLAKNAYQRLLSKELKAMYASEERTTKYERGYDFILNYK